MFQMKNTKLFNLVLFFLIGCFLIINSGCSVIMAIKQPPYKDLTGIKKGITRSEVIAELGTPVLSEEKDGKKKDIFVFKQGYGRGNKAFRVLFHTAADVFTLFLWEVIGTPTELIANGRDVKMEVFYDEKEYVEQANILGEKKEKPIEEPQEKKETKENKEANKNFGP